MTHRTSPHPATEWVTFVRAVAQLAEAAAAVSAAWPTDDAARTLAEAMPYPDDWPDMQELAVAAALWADALERVQGGQGWMLLRLVQGPAAQRLAQCAPPFGPGWSADLAQRLTHVLVWARTYASGFDAVRFDGWVDDQRVASWTLAGY